MGFFTSILSFKAHRSLRAVALVLSALWAWPVIAIDPRVIDFETLPNGFQPEEGLSVSNQFLRSHGVSFAFEDNTYPKIAEIGWPSNLTRQSRPFAFWGPPGSSNPDGLATNQNCGKFFLTDGRSGPNNLGVFGIPRALIIVLASPSSQVSGEIIDIDSNADAWSIEARDQHAQVVASIRLTLQSPNSGDGKATFWSFHRPSAEIQSVRIAYVGTEQSVGWALDNFCPYSDFAPGQLRISASSRTVQLEVAGSFGKAYQLEANSTLSLASWNKIADLVLTNAPVQHYTEVISYTTPARHYRVSALP